MLGVMANEDRIDGWRVSGPSKDGRVSATGPDGVTVTIDADGALTVDVMHVDEERVPAAVMKALVARSPSLRR
jgi:hypothetical protein